MIHFPSFVELNISFIFVLLIGAFAILLALWQYRLTIPQISEIKKGILICLRITTLFLIILLLFQPSLKLIFQEELKPVTAVYIDNSLSMSVTHEKKDRQQIIKNTTAQLEKIKGINWYQFNSRVHPLNIDSLQTPGGATNFENMFKHIESESAQNVIIVSDGNVTDGNYPRLLDQKPEIKLFTIGIGQRESIPDIFIEDVQYQPVIYKDFEQKIKVRIGSSKIADKKTSQIQLIRDGTVLSTKSITFGAQNAHQDMAFSYKSNKLGLNKFKVKLEKFKNETNTLNNTRHFIQQVLKKKLQVDIYCGLPGYESKFLYQLISSQADFECNCFIEGKNGTFTGLTKPDFNTVPDVIVFQNFPGPYTKKQTIERLKSILQNRKSSLLLFLGSGTRLTYLNSFKELLAYEQLPKKRRKEKAGTIETVSQTALNLFNDPFLNKNFWIQLPPLQLPLTAGKLKSKAITLLRTKDNPILVSFSKPGFKSSIFSGEGFWRWHFLLQGHNDFKDGYKTLLERQIRWLANRRELKPLILDTESVEPKPGQPINISVFLYDADFVPIRDGEVSIQVQWNENRVQIAAEMDSSGRYRAAFVPQDEGKITFSAKGIKNNNLIGQDELELQVLPFEKEFVNSALNDTYLKQLAVNGNGLYVSSTGIDSLISTIPQQSSIKKIRKSIDLWNSTFLLALILISVVSEWILRKRFGLE